MGYQSFLSGIMGQVKVLERLLVTREASQATSPEDSPNTSRDKDNASPSEQHRGSKQSPGPQLGGEQTSQRQEHVADSESEILMESGMNVQQQQQHQQETPHHLDMVKTSLVLPSPRGGPLEPDHADDDFIEEEEVTNVEDHLMPSHEEGSSACSIS
ncbi:unnamed protein product [Meganyctiphanes norvegica]|uniref:Uncharacterized protein n=1 Tax=Meganyctiphanes norvegica TaxID=48144 RepID=A0AAV2SNY9_MEGNR